MTAIKRASTVFPMMPSDARGAGPSVARFLRKTWGAPKDRARGGGLSMNTGRNCNGKRRTTSVAFAAALASVVGVLGGAGCSTVQTLNAHRDTVEVTEALQAKLSSDARFSTVQSVKVNPANGVVTLSGRVATDADREAAGKLASFVKGVAMIYNEIQVEKPGP